MWVYIFCSPSQRLPKADSEMRKEWVLCADLIDGSICTEAQDIGDASSSRQYKKYHTLAERKKTSIRASFERTISVQRIVFIPGCNKRFGFVLPFMKNGQTAAGPFTNGSRNRILPSLMLYRNHTMLLANYNWPYSPKGVKNLPRFSTNTRKPVS